MYEQEPKLMIDPFIAKSAGLEQPLAGTPFQAWLEWKRTVLLAELRNSFKEGDSAYFAKLFVRIRKVMGTLSQSQDDEALYAEACDAVSAAHACIGEICLAVPELTEPRKFFPASRNGGWR